MLRTSLIFPFSWRYPFSCACYNNNYFAYYEIDFEFPASRNEHILLRLNYKKCRCRERNDTSYSTIPHYHQGYARFLQKQNRCKFSDLRRLSGIPIARRYRDKNQYRGIKATGLQLNRNGYPELGRYWRLIADNRSCSTA